MKRGKYMSSTIIHIANYKAFHYSTEKWTSASLLQ